MVGAKMVLPGNRMDAASLLELIAGESVTFAVGVPTIWTMLLAHMAEQGVKLTALDRCLVAGTALPPAVRKALKEVHGVTAIHAWGMTETSPIGTMSTPTPEVLALPEGEREAELLKQGRVPFGSEIQIRDAEGRRAEEWQHVRTVVDTRPVDRFGLFQGRGRAGARCRRLVPDGRRRDVGRTRVHEDHRPHQGRHQVRRRMDQLDRCRERRDVAPEGGAGRDRRCVSPEMGRAAGAGHRAEGRTDITREEMLEFLEPRMAKWWLPDDVVFVRELPMTATGKILKSKLREQYWKRLE